MKLAQVFDPRLNALNAIRLGLATEVMLFHSFPLTGHVISPRPVLQLLLSVGVDGFFALSGFLITASWLRNPSARDYFVARALRILPGYYICLVVVAFIVAPIGMAVRGASPARLLMSSEPFAYVLDNIALVQLKLDVGGTPQGIPYPGMWNASLWSLVWEALCYIGVALLGLVGLASRRWVSPVILLSATVGAILLPPLTFPGLWTIPQLLVRTVIMFSAGAVVCQWWDRIPARWSLVVLNVGVVLACSFLPDYRVLGALPLAYAVIVSGALIKNRRWTLRTDLSYGTYIYAFPTQQLLVVSGLSTLNPFLFFATSVAATAPVAALSWFLVEKRALALKARFKRRTKTADAISQGERALSGQSETG